MADIEYLFRLDKYVGPESLAELCFRVICKNLDIISVKEQCDKHISIRTLAKGLVLPSEICDKLFEYLQRMNRIEEILWNHEFFHIFCDTSTTKLKRVKVERSNISNHTAQILASHKLVELELTDCPNVTTSAIEYINANADNLQSLACRGMLSSIFRKLSNDKKYQERGYVFKTPNLRCLALEYVAIYSQEYNLLLAGLTNLTHLDLSNNFNVGYFASFDLVPNLISLVLHNNKINSQAQAFVSSICHLKNLRHLDISQLESSYGRFENPKMILSDIINGLPELTSLDISGTNLAGLQVTVDIGVEAVEHSSYFEFDDTSNSEHCNIQGLASRVNRPLQFLGLYGTNDGACRQRNIPAKLIGGEANEDQILVAAYVYMNNRPGFLQKVLNDLYRLYKYENCHRVDQTLRATLEAMEKHPLEKNIQICGSAITFYIIKMKEKDELPPRLKERIVSTLLTGMSIYKDEESMIRNVCLTLCQFRIPQDVMSNYEALVKVLLHSVMHTMQGGFVQRIGTFILNILACHITGREKLLLGNLGCIKTMLELINYRVRSDIFDEVLEVAWSIMWNMTDETPINSERFFNENGMVLFHKCVKLYCHKQELLKNMMGLLGNVAEIQHLRVHLAQEQYMTLFKNLLYSSSEDIEVPYNAAGILAHIASDGVETWTIKKPTRSEMLELMVEAIEQWDIFSERNINYRSFLPLLRLLDVYHTPQCQHWAVWALANLTTVYPHKYSILVVQEGGIEKLHTLMSDPRPYERIKELAHFVIENCCQSNNSNDVYYRDSPVNVEFGLGD